MTMINDENYKKTQHVVQKLNKFIKIKQMVTLLASEINRKLGVESFELIDDE